MGFRRGGMVGSALVALGNLVMVVGATFPNGRACVSWWVWRLCGTGMGPTSLSFILAVQHAVSWGQRGSRPGPLLSSARSAARSAWVCSARLSVGSWRTAWLCAGATGIDIAAALRPETHKLLRAPINSRLVQANLGLTLRDVYLQMTMLAVGTLVCALWLPNAQATLLHSSTHEREAPEDEGLAVAASEF